MSTEPTSQQNPYSDSASKLEKVFGKLLQSKPFEYRHVRYAVRALYALGAENFDIQMPDVGAGLKIISHPHRYYKTLKGFADSIHAIDDRLDNMPPANILAAGEAHVGAAPSPFLFNPKIFSPTEFKYAREMMDLGFVSKDEGIAFANLASVLVKEEARHTQDFQKSHSVKDRNAMLESDRKISETLVAFIVHWFNRNPAIHEAVEKSDGLTHDDVVKAYPKVTKLFRTMELKDDLLDLVPDLKQEVDTGKPVANWFLSKLHEKGMLLDDKGGIQPYLKEFLSKNAKRTKNITVAELPEPLQATVKEATEEYKSVARGFPKVMADVLSAEWDRSLHLGCNTMAGLENHTAAQL